MGDFKSFNGSEGGKKGEEAAHGNGSVNAAENANLMASLAAAMSGKSTGQIWQLILKQAEQGKRDGTLTNADLDNFYAAVSPMVDGFKRQKLKSVINRLKSI